MKNIVLVFLLCFSLFGCFQKEDDYFQPHVELKEAFVFDNKKEYAVGDTIYLDLNFSRYLEEEGYSNLLDIYETTGAEKFS
ncbi:hypothetical protein JQC67_01820 [Aurantibacter crassamenti]|uniref:hypothetical protein n=1 Tax=Aurantibacter crassamenti TaxID=1837375 RepID=UPI00193A8EB6|nr:hypothetical protein [Aurantibacter crassamenti]MBM1104864.1 hypothetical protein [Aurantibacter crassamenti]